jgi:hypothetical protein
MLFVDSIHKKILPFLTSLSLSQHGVDRTSQGRSTTVDGMFLKDSRGSFTVSLPAVALRLVPSHLAIVHPSIQGKCSHCIWHPLRVHTSHFVVPLCECTEEFPASQDILDTFPRVCAEQRACFVAVSPTIPTILT